VNKTTFINLPGIGGSAAGHWQTLWEQSDPSIRRFKPLEWDNPQLPEWNKALQDAVDAAESPVVLVAHSLSCLLVAHWAAQTQTVVAGAFLVAVPDPEAPVFPKAAASFREVPALPLPFRSLIVASTNDLYGTIEYMERRAKEWGSQTVNIGDRGHINASSNLGEWREGKTLLHDFVGELDRKGS